MRKSFVLDETMGAVSFLNKMPAVTASLTVNYYRPLPVEKTVYIITQVEKTEGRKIYIIGKMVDKNQRLFADSKGIFVKVPNERIGL